MPRPTTTPSVHRFNQELGRRISERRTALGLSISQMEKALLVPRGMIGRLERGEKGLDAGLLIAMTQILDVPVGYFFDGLAPGQTGNTLAKPAEELVEEVRILLTSFHSIESVSERRQILALVRAIADPGS